MNPLLHIDFYKVGHIDQYPAGITQVWSNWTPRSSRISEVDRVVNFGIQYFIKKYLIQDMWDHFFSRARGEVIAEYTDIIGNALNISKPRTDHIESLWKLQYLPLKIYSIPEGNSTPLGVPSIVITNTHPDFFWLPNYIETLMSQILWKPSTSATTARIYRSICEKWAIAAGETDLSAVDWMCHDFSARGMSGIEDAALSGLGHLLFFKGTDTVDAIRFAQKYYDGGKFIGGSVPATEHSVMCAGEMDGELETFRRLIDDVYPNGIVSIVSDTWDLWKVLTEYIPQLKDKILSRDGKIVIRPDSGDPVKIMCGNGGTFNTPVCQGVMRLLASAMGTTQGTGKLPMINKAAAIYGDSITPERADQILGKTVKEIGLSPYNVVLGVGSYTYEYVTRDTYGFAMKATAIRNSDGDIIPIFKNPVTDSGMKRSCKGIPIVYRTASSSEDRPEYKLVQGGRPEDLDNCAMEAVFEDGNLLVSNNIEAIRKRARAW